MVDIVSRGVVGKLCYSLRWSVERARITFVSCVNHFLSNGLPLSLYNYLSLSSLVLMLIDTYLACFLPPTSFFSFQWGAVKLC